MVYTKQFMISAVENEALLSPQVMAREIPLNQEHSDSIKRWRKTVGNILAGREQRLLVIVGPCSIHDREGALSYAQKLRRLQEKIAKRIFLVMRCYVEKPRTIIGWKGYLHDPDLDGSADVLKGIRKVRSLLVDLTEMGVPAASELLELTTTNYYAEFLTWGCIGARTSSSQPHRQLASAMPFPIGFKNSTEGNLEHPIHGIVAAKRAQTFVGIDSEGFLARIASKGNNECHLVLRGATNNSNYDTNSIEKAILLCLKACISSNLMVDCSHDNSKKEPLKQVEIFKKILTTSHKRVGALMLESNLLEGQQEITPFIESGLSVTDPCLDWPATEELLLWAYNHLEK